MKTSNKGFTLIELMIVIVIVAILAAIAVPSYRNQMMRNSESQVQTRLHELTIELERHKSTRLNYAGFAPKVERTESDGSKTITYEYDSGDTIVYVPKGSSSSNYKYQITLVDIGGMSLSTIDSSISWKMYADPNPNDTNLAGAEHYLVFSSGERCKDKVNSLSSATSCTGKTSW